MSALRRLLTTYIYIHQYHSWLILNSGTGLIDTSDHLPILFCITDVSVSRSRNKIQLRNYGLTLVKNCTGVIFVQSTGMLLSVRTPNINDLTHSITGAVKVVVDKHISIRAASRNKQKHLRKPWITNSRLKSI